MTVSNLATPYGFQSFPHFTEGRQGNKVNKIVIHHMATTNYDIVPGCWNNREASAHYGIGKNGEIRAYVDENNTAWHAGDWNANTTSIGIEHCNATGEPNWNINQATIDASARLCSDIAKRHGLGTLVPNKNVFSHSAFVATGCPGQLLGKLQEICNKANAMNAGSVPPPSPSPNIVKDNGRYRVNVDVANVRYSQNTKSGVHHTRSKGYEFVSTNYCKNGENINGDTIWLEDNGVGWISRSLCTYLGPNNPTAPTTKKLTVQVNGLNVRNAPRLNATVVGVYNKGANWTLPKGEQFAIHDGYVWARTPIGYCAVGRNTGKAETDDFITIS